MIKTFADKHTLAIWMNTVSKKLPTDISKRAKLKLKWLHAASRIDDLRFPPSNCLEALKGEREGQWSLRINDQWRLCFRFEDGDAYDVGIIDYH
jgi:Plasmid maintenance system killer protein